MKTTTKKARGLRVLILAAFTAASGCAVLPPQQQSQLQKPTPALAQKPDAALSKPEGEKAAADSSSPSPSSQQRGNDGKYYLDDGPPDDSRIAFADIPDAVPRQERINPAHNRPYTALGLRFVPDTAPRQYRKRGMASWYGKRYHGRKTSTGEVYDMFQMTAAHPTLAIPSYVRVTRADTGESVVVRVNDRGPFLGGRIIDLSYAAAGRLGFIKDGTAEVIVESILPPGFAGGNLPQVNNDDDKAEVNGVKERGFYVQFGAFSLAANADKMRAELSAKTSLAAVVIGGGGLFRVVAGPYQDWNIAEAVRDDLCADGWCGLVKELP